MKFAGHERDLGDTSSAADDLDYMHARFCNPQLGRFLRVDPKGRYKPTKLPQRWNRYAYAIGSPLKYVDPNGQDLKIVYDFRDSGLTQRQQLQLQIAVRRVFVRAGVRNVQSYTPGGSIRSREVKPTDRIVRVKIQSAPLKSGGFGSTPPLSDESTVSTDRAPEDPESKMKFLVNVTSHEIGHASGALQQYSFDGIGGPSGDAGTVMQESTSASSYSTTMLDFSKQDAMALQQRLNDPCEGSEKKCGDKEPQ
jgi:RHS repeat-associated protein